MLDDLYQYVPSAEEVCVHQVTTESGNHTDKIRDIKYHRLLFAGDQLTVKRAWSARSQHDNSQHAQGKTRALYQWLKTGTQASVFWSKPVFI